MSLETVAWSTLYHGTQAPEGRVGGVATLRRMGTFVRVQRRRILGYLVLSTVAAAISIVPPLLAGRVVDHIVARAAVSTIALLATAIAVLAIAEAAFALIVRWLSATIGEGLIYTLRTAVFDHVQTMPVAFFTRTRTGALVSRLNNDVLGAQRAFSDTLSGVVTNLVTLLLTLTVMLTISWQVTLLSLILVPLFVIPSRFMGRKVAELSRKAAQHNASMSDSMTERFSAPGATLIKLFGRPALESQRFAARAADVRDIGISAAMVRARFTQSLMLMSALALALVYGVGGGLAVSGGLAPGAVVTLALLLTQLYAPLAALANARVEVMTALVSFERVFEVLDLAPMVADRPAAIDQPAGAHGIAFENVRFGYPAATEVSLASLESVAVLDSRTQSTVLAGISFDAPAGTMTAIVGSSGAGKSTIAQLATRLYDVDAGVVRIGGVDVREVTQASLHRRIGLVTQDGHLFHDTIRANLTLAAPEATDEQLRRALAAARLLPLVESLGDGLDTVVGERGYRLSGGERQRLTIARLLLAAPDVVILDEATAHLDSTSEAAVQEALTEALSGRTAIVIAHRLSTIAKADQILVVEDGRIVERGTQSELLALGGRFADLHQTQFHPAA